MYTPQAYRPISRKRLNLPSERMVVNGVGLGEVDGLFNIGKMFTRMFTIRPKSFTFGNIAGAIGSVAMTTGTMGLIGFAPKIQSAHSTIAKDVGFGVMAAAAVVGGGVAIGAMLPAAGAGLATGSGLIGTAAAGSSTIGAALGTGAAASTWTVGGVLSTVGSGLMTAMKALPLIGQVFGGGKQPQQQADYGPQQPTAQEIAAQAAYDVQVRAQQAAMYTPGGYVPNIPGITPQYTGPVTPSMDNSYGDLRSPYTAVTEDGQQVQVDPKTGQVVQAGMLPDLSATTWLAIGGATLAGWYLMSGSKSNN